MKTTFSTNPYVNSHGHAPKGYGTWAFMITLEDGRGGFADAGMFFANGTLTATKKQAKEHALSIARSESRCKEVLIDILG